MMIILLLQGYNYITNSLGNELFIAEIIFSHVLESLTPAQLAAVVCAITTEDLRIDIPYLPISEPVRKTLNLIRNIRRKLEKSSEQIFSRSAYVYKSLFQFTYRVMG